MKEIIIKALKKTKREGITDLIKYMESVGFFEAPCSGGNHLCKEGGLAEHSVNVMNTALKLGKALLDKEEFKEMESSIIICSLLHDLGKTGDYGKKLYVDNILKSGKQSASKPFKRNSELTNIPHSRRSTKLAWFYIDLTEDEEWAIEYHDGLYDRETGGMAIIPGHETKLYMILHWADLWSARITEANTEESEDE